MTTAEKRADLEAKGEPWPECECHGEPMLWTRDLALIANGRFRCRMMMREQQRAMRQARSEAGVCTECGEEDLATTLRCGRCAERQRERQWHYDQTPRRQLHRYLRDIRRRVRDKDSQPTGIGRVAMAAYLDQKVEQT